MKRIGTLLCLAAVLSSSGCTPASAISQEGFVTSAIGSATGGGLGYLVGTKIGKKLENTLLGSGIGAGAGLLIGGWLHEKNVQIAKKRAVVVREAKMISRTQLEIDSLREQLTDSTTWGRNEVRPWNERYSGEDSDYPYQGPLGTP